MPNTFRRLLPLAVVLMLATTGCGSDSSPWKGEDTSEVVIQSVGYPTPDNLKLTQVIVKRLADEDVDGLTKLSEPVADPPDSDVARRTARNWVAVLGKAARGEVIAEFYDSPLPGERVVLYFKGTDLVHEMTIFDGNYGHSGVILSEPDRSKVGRGTADTPAEPGESIRIHDEE